MIHIKQNFQKKVRCLVIAAFICTAIVLSLNAVAAAEKTNVFFIHGAIVSEQDARAWAATIFKGLYQAGANMEFCPIAWESDIGPDYNYYENVSNAFE